MICHVDWSNLRLMCSYQDYQALKYGETVQSLCLLARPGGSLLEKCRTPQQEQDGGVHAHRECWGLKESEKGVVLQLTILCIIYYIYYPYWKVTEVWIWRLRKYGFGVLDRPIGTKITLDCSSMETVKAVKMIQIVQLQSACHGCKHCSQREQLPMCSTLQLANSQECGSSWPEHMTLQWLQDWLWNCSKTLGHYQWFCCSWVWPSNSANISAPNMCHAYAESAQQYFPILHITSACACSLRADCSCKRDKSCSPWPAIERSWHRSDFAISSVGVRTKTMQVRKITAVLRIKSTFVKVFEIIEGAHTVISVM